MTLQRTIAIQGELGSNSHLAAREIAGAEAQIVPCNYSAEVIAKVVSGAVEAAVLPIENSLHGSVAEHYDLLLESPLVIRAEQTLRIEHHLIAAPGVTLEEVRVVLSHPVAISQCRRFLASMGQARALPFYDTAGSVAYVLRENRRDEAGIAPRLAAEMYGGHVLAANIEDYRENLTRFFLLRHRQASTADDLAMRDEANKMSLAFTVAHRPGSLVAALQQIADAGANLTKIESRPVPGRPWEYIFFADLRFDGVAMAKRGLSALARQCQLLKELGRYVAAT